ncbi:MAG: glutamate 5-kinase [Kiritimatiellia bacterium]|jgi:glutamate 5-kinase|nr:glutamate 5-kinase [Kiritimatiellia bacterium]
MKKSLKYREALTDVRRVVVKIGSRVLVQKSGRPDARRMRALIQQLSALHMEGKEVVVVTSGAVGAGMEALGLGKRPATLPEQQMAAAVGQTRLMSRYSELFSARGVNVGQVLLTHHDFQHKIRMTNARRTMEIMIRNRVIPIINENDVVADEEIRADMVLRDNDYLAALVVKLIRADLLLLLTTVDGLREAGKSGRTRRVRYLETINRNTFALVTESRSRLSKGGMASKLKAAKSVSRAGCSAVIANGRKDDVIIRTMAGEDVGTLVLASAL